MNRIVLTGAVLLVLGHAAVAANPEQKPARHTDQAPVLQQPGSGTKVDEVAPDSAAAKAGIRPGDVIIGINGKPINTYLDIAPILAASGGRPLTIDIDRGGTRVRVKATPHRSNEPTPQDGAQHWLLGITHTETMSGQESDKAGAIVPPIAPAAPPPPNAPVNTPR
ncbi:MAG: PDZ domain-containing protein [Beijerinckiaceae bacterium]